MKKRCMRKQKWKRGKDKIFFILEALLEALQTTLPEALLKALPTTLPEAFSEALLEALPEAITYLSWEFHSNEVTCLFMFISGEHITTVISLGLVGTGGESVKWKKKNKLLLKNNLKCDIRREKKILTSSSTKFPRRLEPDCGAGNAGCFPKYLKNKISVVLHFLFFKNIVHLTLYL